MAVVRRFTLVCLVLKGLNAIPLWTLNFADEDDDSNLQPQAAYDACKVFFTFGGHHINIASNSTTWQLRALAEAIQNRDKLIGASRAPGTQDPLFISAELVLSMGYEKSAKALQRMLSLLEISRFDLVLVGPGDEENCGELCVAGSLAAAEHTVRRWGAPSTHGTPGGTPGGLGGVGVSGWSLLQLQRMTPLLRFPLQAVKLDMDFMSASHLLLVKYCLAKNISLILRCPHPGRLTGMVLLHNSTEEEVSFTARVIAFDWLHSKSASIALPYSMKDEDMLTVMVASQMDLSNMEKRAKNIEQQFWPRWGEAPLYKLYDNCPTGLGIDSAWECDNARKDLSLAVEEVEYVDVSGCFTRCNSCGSESSRAQKAICQKDVAAEVPQQASTLFLAMCMGSEYFNHYCAPFFLSFVRTYRNERSRLHIWSIAVELEQLSKARRLLRQLGAQNVDFEEGDFAELKEQWSKEHSGGVEDYLDESGEDESPISNRHTGCSQSKFSGDTVETVCDPGVHDERMLINNVIFFKWVIQQMKLPENQMFQYVVTIDSDTLLCKSFERFLPFIPKDGESDDMQWDYAFTVYDEGHEVPWGSNEEVAKTKKGHLRLNAGVQLFKNTPTLLGFLSHYLETIQYVLKWGHISFEGSEENPVAELLAEFKSPNQAAIALIVGTSNLQYGNCSVCWPHILHLETRPELATTLGGIFSVRVQGLPVRYLNHPESLKDGEIPDDLHVLHLKGLWWRILVMEATAHPTETRCYDWNFEAYVYWLAMFRIWKPEYDVSVTILADNTKCSNTVSPSRPHPLV